MLLDQAKIPFIQVGQKADEQACDWGKPLEQLTASIAEHKMNHVILPDGNKEGEVCFVLTADTLSQEADGTISGKPIDKADAIKKIKAARAGMRTGTAFCLDRRVWHNGIWEIEKRIEQFVDAQYEFNIPDEWVTIYFQDSNALNASGAIMIEEFGTQFLKSVSGSYSAIVGLPMYELREALEELGFFGN